MSSKNKLSNSKTEETHRSNLDGHLPDESLCYFDIGYAPPLNLTNALPLHVAPDSLAEELRSLNFLADNCVNCVNSRQCPTLKVLLRVVRHNGLYSDARISFARPRVYFPHETELECRDFSPRIKDADARNRT